MKRRLLMLFCVCSATLAYAQVGVNMEPENGKMLQVQSGTAGTAGQVVVDDTGKVGIGTNTPTEKLHVVGNAVVVSTGASDGNMDVDGNIHVGGNTRLGTQGGATSAKLEIVGTGNLMKIEVEKKANLPDTLYMTTGDDYGTGRLSYLRPNTKFDTETISSITNGTTVSRSGTGDFINVSTPLTLDPGKWLILAQVIVQSAATTYSATYTTTNYPFEALLYSGSAFNGSDASSGIITTASTLVSRTTATGSRFGIVDIVYMVHITQPQTYWIGARINSIGTTTAGYQFATNSSAVTPNPYFYAIQLDDQ